MSEIEMEDNQNTAPPVSEIPNPLSAEALAKVESPPVTPNSTSSVIPGLTRNPEPPVSNPVKPSKKISMKLIIGIIAFFILAGGAAASFTVFKPQIMSLISKPTPTPAVIPDLIRDPSPTPDPTANWKTYSGDGFTFKYPQEWSYTSEAGKQFFSKKVREPQPTGPFENLPTDTRVTLQVTKKAQNESLENWAQNETVRRGMTEFIPVIKKTKAAGIDSIETDFPSMHGERLTVFIKNDNVFVINLDYATPEDEKAQREFKDQILSTFKFTDTQEVDTSNWRTYEGNGFTVKYPANFNNVDGKLRSSDYKLDKEGIEFLVEGVEIRFITQLSSETSIEKVFEKDILLNQIATSKTTSTIDGKSAIRYEFSYESTQATATKTINNGVLYDIQLVWPDAQTKEQYTDVYNHILSTFKFNK